ncbi:MAG: 30S ribosomal protein S17e [Candidatus Woesearchaeota archaeon]
MGRIKSKKVKAVTLELVKMHRERFATDFDKNKKALAVVADIPSKKLRNVVAGYVTRRMKCPE